MSSKQKFILITTMYGSVPPMPAGDIVELTAEEADSPLWKNSVRPVPPKLANGSGADDIQALRAAWEKEKADGMATAKKEIQDHADKTLDAAQKQADKIVADAQAQADKIVADATEKAGTLTPATPAATSGKVAKDAAPK